jgi:neutral ceramidase
MGLRFAGRGWLLVAVLIGSIGVARADDLLRAGVAAANITPEPGFWLWGYSNRTHGATGTLDPLMAKAVVLALGDRKVAIVALDLGRTPEDAVLARVREHTRARCGVADLFVTASHTHHAPVMENTPDDPNPYGDRVGDAIEKIVCQAAGELAPVKVGVAGGEADFAHNRRKFLLDGRVAMQWRNAEHEPTEPVDRQYTVIRLDREDGSPLAVLFHYACHPVVMGGDNYHYSADFVGPCCAAVEKDLKTTCLFLQGACGNLNPYLDKTPLNQGGAAEARKMGEALGALVTKTAREAKPVKAAMPVLQFVARTVPVRTRWDLNDAEVRALLSKAYGPRFDKYLSRMIKDNTVPCTLTALVINSEVALVGMPGEIFVQFQTALKQQSPLPHTLLVGYTNGYHAYFPTIRDAAAGGYGGKTATYVEPGAGERLTNEALVTLFKLADQLHDVPREQDFKLLDYDDVKHRAASKP